MGKLGEFTDALMGSARTISNVYEDKLTKQATLSTQTKNIQLQNDINGQLARIRQSSNYEDWNTQINDFFTQVKSGMSNKDSPYYCQNNLQAEQFEKILEQNQVNVSDQVGRMVQQRQSEKRVLDVQNSKTMLADMAAGQTYIDQANELDRGLYENGDISLEQYQKSKDQNYISAYQDMRIKTFDASLGDALAQGKSFEAFYSDIENNMPELKATDTDGLERAINKDALKKTIKSTCQQNYNAKLQDIQQGNANALSQIVQEMRQQNTAEGKVSAARRGQMAMNRMQGLKLSETDRLQYSAIFELALGGDSLKGSGSGSGSGGKASDYDSYEKLIKANPQTAMDLIRDGTVENTYEAIQVVSNTLVDEWYNGNYKENFEKDAAERDETFNLLYKGQTSENAITDAIFNEAIKKYPTAENLLTNKCKKLMEDIQKNPKKYGSATVGELADFITDWVLGADRNATDDDFVKALDQRINSCYAESIKYVQLDKKGNLDKKFNANVDGDIAKAARIAQENDYVYTYQGQERWGEGKKEALEAEGGIVDVLKNAVASTLNIPENERGKVDFYYKPDAQHDDLTSTPIITYGNKAYEVIPNDDNKGFKLKEVHTGEMIDGTTGVKEATAARKEAKADAKAQEKAAAEDVATIKKEREKKVEESLTASKQTPKAVSASNVISSDEKEWKWGVSTNEDKKTILNQSINKIDKAADKVKDTLAGKAKKKNQMTKEQFKQEYGIDYDEWIKDKETSRRYDLIINSK